MSKTKPFIPVKNEATKALFSNSILDCLYRGRLQDLSGKTYPKKLMSVILK